MAPTADQDDRARTPRPGAERLTAIVDDESPAAIGFWEAAGYHRQRHRARFVRPR